MLPDDTDDNCTRNSAFSCAQKNSAYVWLSVFQVHVKVGNTGRLNARISDNDSLIVQKDKLDKSFLNFYKIFPKNFNEYVYSPIQLKHIFNGIFEQFHAY